MIRLDSINSRSLFSLFRNMSNCTLNESLLKGVYNYRSRYECIPLAIIPLLTIAGNLLVVLAVASEKSLKTSTNYLLVSLAVADMLVAALVMPFSLYMLINQFYWFLDDWLCVVFIVGDVGASTASIVHLMAISVDRFYAVTKHTKYQTKAHERCVSFTIGLLWVFSTGLGLTLSLLLKKKTCFICSVENAYFMLYGSIFAFYIPLFIMTIMYGFVFHRLRARLRSVRLQEMAASQMVTFGHHLDDVIMRAHEGRADLKTLAIQWAMPYLNRLEDSMLSDDSDAVSMNDLHELTNLLQQMQKDTVDRYGADMVPIAEVMIEEERDRSESERIVAPCTPYQSSNGNKVTPSSPALSNYVTRRHMSEAPMMKLQKFRSRFSSLTAYLDPIRHTAKAHSIKFKSVKERAVSILMRMMSKEGNKLRKETRATKLVVTVMIVFLICYTPFFTLNLVKVYEIWYGKWTVGLEHWLLVFSWFGYVNSCLNPLIYAVINRKFREAFRKILRIKPQKNEPTPFRKSTLRMAAKYQTRSNEISPYFRVELNNDFSELNDVLL